MALPRPFALVQTEDQWLRCAHRNTALVGNVVELEFANVAAPAPAAGPYPEPAGLAFDSNCRLYHSVPEQGRVERQLWAGGDPLDPAVPRPDPVELFAPVVLPPAGDFQRVPPPMPALKDPRALAVDGNQRLFIAEASAGCVLVFDLWSSRLLRRVAMPGRPVDLALLDDDSVLVLLQSPAGLAHMDARTEPAPRALPAAVTVPGRIAVSPSGERFVLDRPGDAHARVIADQRAPIDAPFATDLEFLPGPADDSGTPSAILVLAFQPDADFARLRIAASSVEQLPPLKGRGYDGRGIVRTPDGRIGFWTAKGFRHAVAARVRYAPKGRVVTYQLDGGAYRMQWGRLFLDACIPANTAITVACIATDEPPSDPPMVRTPPSNVTLATVPRPELSPAMPPGSLTPASSDGVYRRDTGRELPWARFADGDPFQTYEAEILSGPGRFLWVFVEMTGDTRFTPRLRSLRAEYPSHDLLRRLPRIFSREEAAASFLRRYLAMFDGALGELDGKGAARHALLEPLGAPAEVLPWLGGFLGMVLDERWPAATQRQVIQEAMWLFRFRGTPAGLQRFLELYLGIQPILIEKFRLRGIGTVGDSTGPFSTAILGAGFRVGGAVGQSGSVPLSGSVDDAFDTHAHRFTVMIPGSLTDEQMAVVQQILDVHRPAHTIVDVCTVGAGMRVGRGLMIGMTSVIGRTGRFRTLQAGASVLGRDAVVGRPVAGTIPGASLLGGNSRVG